MEEATAEAVWFYRGLPVLMLRADCSLFTLKPAHFSAVAHSGGLVPA